MAWRILDELPDTWGLREWLTYVHADVAPPPSITYEEIKQSVLLPPKTGPKGSKEKSERHQVYDRAQAFVVYYGIDRDAVVGTKERPVFRRDHYANWPYLAAGLRLVVEMAKETTDAVHVVRKRVERDLNKDLRQDTHLHAVFYVGRES